RDVAKLPEASRRTLEDLHRSHRVLPGKTVLIVDDDMRNIFALTTVLEEQDMTVISADNGRDAINFLQSRRDVDIVLMDIMMPEMDGLDTMRALRKVPHLQSLPIIAVTAKAMKGDREKCIEAGAWDYLAKPVDIEQMPAGGRGGVRRGRTGGGGGVEGPRDPPGGPVPLLFYPPRFYNSGGPSRPGETRFFGCPPTASAMGIRSAESETA